MNRDKQLRLAKQAGCDIKHKRRSGELIVTHPRMYELIHKRKLRISVPERSKTEHGDIKRLIRRLGFEHA